MTKSFQGRYPALLTLAALMLLLGCNGSPVAEEANEQATIDDFVTLCSLDQVAIEKAFQRIENDWPEGSLTMLAETLRFIHKDSAKIRYEIPRVLKEKAGIRVERVFNPQIVLKKIWNEEYKPHPKYATFKAKLHARLDPLFVEYFDASYPATIRLDEVTWGGVKRDGIPPLKDPKVLPAAEASYLGDTDVVFGVYVNGQARCYPKRILGYHEMVKDVVGGVSINGVYCTMCGSMIVYFTEHDGKHYELGTSGFLYRANKLMYDHETKSLWSTLTGEPVVGLLVGKGIKLKRHHVVTTTWGEWKKLNPDTDVLSLETGYTRDYREGKAYEDYFNNDKLRFETPFEDRRLKNKDEILALRFNDASEKLAISVEFLQENPIYYDSIGRHEFVVITDSTGANRVYEKGAVKFSKLEGHELVDMEGNRWKVSESSIANESGVKLERLPAHRAFWFGWHAAFPDTRLVSE